MPRTTLAAFDLKAARKMRGLSQVAVAQILCTTQPSVARWEAQGNMPEVFRKVWALHWQVEGIKLKMSGGADVSLAKLERKHDARPNKRNRKSNARKRKVEDSKEGTSGGATRSLDSVTESEEVNA
jgi:transcriptional regulator with XRE-family HTH domain